MRSEAYGFIISLRYTNKPGTDNPYFTKAEVDAMLTKMVSGKMDFGMLTALEQN
jgi:uncharacterized protein YneF (UPF0154 family)